MAAAADLRGVLGRAGGARAPEKLTYGFEMNGTLVGYVEITVSRGSGPAQGLRVIEDRIFAKLTLLGQAFDLDAHMVYRVDPASGRLRSYDGDIRQGARRQVPPSRWRATRRALPRRRGAGPERSPFPRTGSSTTRCTSRTPLPLSVPGARPSRPTRSAT